MIKCGQILVNLKTVLENRQLNRHYLLIIFAVHFEFQRRPCQFPLMDQMDVKIEYFVLLHLLLSTTKQSQVH